VKGGVGGVGAGGGWGGGVGVGFVGLVPVFPPSPVTLRLTCAFFHRIHKEQDLILLVDGLSR